MVNAKGKKIETGTKIIIILFVILCAMLIAMIAWVACDVYKTRLNEKWMIGKTADEIAQRYGDFYGGKGPALDDHSECTQDKTYHRALYIAKEERVGFFGTDPEEFIVLYFDCDGVCISTERKTPAP